VVYTSGLNFTVLASKIGWMTAWMFGNPLLAGAVLFIMFSVSLYRAGVPMDASIAVVVPVLIALSGILFPQWVGVFVVVGLAMFAGLAFYRLFMSP